MKATGFILLLIVLFACENEPVKKIIHSYSNGAPEIVVWLNETKTGVDTVKRVEFYENGNTRMEGKYKNNQRDGYWQYFFENGKPWSEGTFKEGKSHGSFHVYNEDGSLRFESNYKEGKPDGKWTFYTNGKKIKEVIFENGRKLHEFNH